MASFTAEFKIAQCGSHYDGTGISGNYKNESLLLSENSRCAWLLKSSYKKSVWIPHPDTILDDALLMIAVNYIEGLGADKLRNTLSEMIDESILKLPAFKCKKMQDPTKERLDALYNLLTREQLGKLHSQCRKLNWSGLKLILSVYEDSAVRFSLDKIREYPLLIEVCSPVYSRVYSSWSNSVIEKGYLPEGGKISRNFKPGGFNMFVYPELPEEIEKNIKFMLCSRESVPENSVHWYEFCENLKLLLKRKSDSCSKSTEEIMRICGYNKKSEHKKRRFNENVEKWLNLADMIPLAYLEAIDVTSEELDKAVDADFENYHKALKEAEINFCSFDGLYGQFLNQISFEKAVELCRLYSEIRDLNAFLEIKELKAACITPDGKVNLFDYKPILVKTRYNVYLKNNPLLKENPQNQNHADKF